MKKRTNVYLVVFFLIIFSILVFAKKDSQKFFLDISNSMAASLNNGGQKIHHFFDFASNIANLRKQNEQLSSDLLKLNVDRSKINELEHENRLLKEELGFAEKNKDQKLLPVKIVGRDPASFLDHVIIDKGEKDGVVVGAGAVSGGGLIGQVSEVYPNQSRVTLITSKDSMILAMLQNSRSKGILKGGISGLILENIVQDTEYEVGEYIITSGLDGELPPGILIGKTGLLESSSSDLFKNIYIEPFCDLSKLEIVFIML